MLFNEVVDIAQFDLANARTFKDLWNEIQVPSSTCPALKYFQGLNLAETNSNTCKDFQGWVETLNSVSTRT